MASAEENSAANHPKTPREELLGVILSLEIPYFNKFPTPGPTPPTVCDTICLAQSVQYETSYRLNHNSGCTQVLISPSEF
jgi:hypothetical protein